MKNTQILLNRKISHDTTKISGIYKIINKVNNKYYIGSSDNILRRKYNHFYELRKNKHGNKKLQNAWNKYGDKSFDFIIVEKIPDNNLLKIEQKYLDICKENPETNYNIGYDAIAFMKGKHHTPEAISLIIKRHKGRKCSEDQKKNQSIIMMGKYSGNKNPNYGKIMPERTKQSLILSRMDKTLYTFENTKTREIFSGNRIDFRNHIKVGRDSIHLLVKGKIKSCKGWTLLNLNHFPI